MKILGMMESNTTYQLPLFQQYLGSTPNYLRVADLMLTRACRDLHEDKHALEAQEWLYDIGLNWALLLGLDHDKVLRQIDLADVTEAPETPLKREHGKQVEEACKIVLDPDPAGFRYGAEFNVAEAREMLFLGHFTPKTILQIGTRQYLIEGEIDSPQTLKGIEP